MENNTINKRFYHKKPFKIMVSVVLVLALGFLCSFIPTLSLKTSGMKELKGEYITVYYETEEVAAKDVFELANSESERISKTLGFDEPQNIRMYIYDNQNTFQTKKYGYIALLLNLDWYIGDNRGTNVLLTSPANPGKAHDYNDVKFASIHEMVHAYNSILNSNMSLWVNEGIALYLSNGNPPLDLYSTSYFVPDINQTRTSSPVEFANIGGYDFAHTYIEYLDDTFGWESVLVFAKTSDYMSAFEKSESEIYDGWVEFLKENYS
jgi:hypothetical protein